MRTKEVKSHGTVLRPAFITSILLLRLFFKKSNDVCEEQNSKEDRILLTRT